MYNNIITYKNVCMYFPVYAFYLQCYSLWHIYEAGLSIFLWIIKFVVMEQQDEFLLPFDILVCANARNPWIEL